MKRAYPLAGLLLFLSLACSMPTPTPVPAAFTPTATPALSATPTTAFTPTPVERTLVVGGEKINCRFGPGVAYAFVNELQAGQSAHAVGRNESATWWYIRDPGNPDGYCWASAQVTEIIGAGKDLPVIAPPFIHIEKIGLRTEPQKIFVACDQFPQTIFFEAEIEANGPTIAVWRLESDSGYSSADDTIIFEEAGVKTLNGYYQVNGAGDHWIQIHLLKPNDLTEKINFPANCTP